MVDVAKGEAGRFTYRQLNARANRLAAHLRASCGVGRGDRVALLAMNGVEVLDTFFACGKLGAVFVPLNWRAHARECREVAELTTPKVLVFSEDLGATAAALLGEGSSLEHALHLSGEGLAGSVRFSDVVNGALTSPTAPVVNEQVTRRISSACCSPAAPPARPRRRRSRTA